MISTSCGAREAAAPVAKATQMKCCIQTSSGKVQKKGLQESCGISGHVALTIDASMCTDEFGSKILEILAKKGSLVESEEVEDASEEVEDDSEDDETTEGWLCCKQGG